MKKTLAFFGTCAARSELTLVSPRISTPFLLKRVLATWALSCQDLMSYRVYITEDPSAPTTGKPMGISVLADYGQVDYLVGDGIQLDLHHEVPQPVGGSYLKVYADNQDFYPHDVNVQLEIEIPD